MRSENLLRLSGEVCVASLLAALARNPPFVCAGGFSVMEDAPAFAPMRREFTVIFCRTKIRYGVGPQPTGTYGAFFTLGGTQRMGIRWREVEAARGALVVQIGLQAASGAWRSDEGAA